MTPCPYPLIMSLVGLADFETDFHFESEFPAIILGNPEWLSSSQTTQGTTMGEYEAKKDDSKIEFSNIFLGDTSTSDTTLSYEPTISPLNESKIDFRISLDESNNDDYTVIFDENSFSYKIISINNLKTDSKNNNDKVNIPLPPSPEPEDLAANEIDLMVYSEK
ncbi:hypothetical protein Tco_1260474 [Tanacetum coccineum]